MVIPHFNPVQENRGAGFGNLAGLWNIIGRQSIFTYNELATLARATRVVNHSIFVLGPSALGKWENCL